MIDVVLERLAEIEYEIDCLKFEQSRLEEELHDLRNQQARSEDIAWRHMKI